MRGLAIFLFFFGLVSSLQFIGVNQAVAEFGNNIPGSYGTDYTYPTTASIDYFVNKGMNIFRVPFLWERMQTSLNGALSTTELGYLDAIVNYVTKTKGVYCLIDPHNYARYSNQLIGSGVAVSAFTDFWTKLATHYKGNSKVVFGIMNEPHDMSTEVWRDAANAAITAIRNTGATNLITVPGNAWTGAWTWTSNSYGTPNSVAMLSINDPLNNFIYEVHQYLDDNGSGTSATCVSSTIGSQRLQAFTNWCRQYGKKALLGEFAGGDNPTCASAVSDMLNFMKSNSDVWVGWTWWSAGPWWGSYMYSLEPGTGNSDKPQMSTITPYIQVTPISPVTSNAAPQTSNVPQTSRPTQTPQTSKAGQTSSALTSDNGVPEVTSDSPYITEQTDQMGVSENAPTPITVIVNYNLKSNDGHSSTTTIAAAVGASVGGLLVVAAAVVLLLVLRRRGRARSGSSDSLMGGGTGTSTHALNRTDSSPNVASVPINTLPAVPSSPVTPKQEPPASNWQEIGQGPPPMGPSHRRPLPTPINYSPAPLRHAQPPGASNRPIGPRPPQRPIPPRNN